MSKGFDKYRKLFWEIFRFGLVGGIAFVVDAGALFLAKEYLLPDMVGQTEIYVATAIGFLFGLVVNYLMSISFVFKAVKDKASVRTKKAFIIFAVMGTIGFLLTELGMFAGVELLLMNYMLVKVLVTLLVMVWNYISRKILIFK